VTRVDVPALAHLREQYFGRGLPAHGVLREKVLPQSWQVYDVFMFIFYHVWSFKSRGHFAMILLRGSDIPPDLVEFFEPIVDGLKNVLTINPKPTKEAHFATYPPALVTPCIKAGSSEMGCCPECGAPWARVVEKVDTGKTQKMADGWATHAGGHGTIHRDGREKGQKGKPITVNQTVGWRPTCEHGPRKPVPCTVLDPFNGSGTTGMVALELGRCYTGIDLSPEYINDIAIPRIQQRLDGVPPKERAAGQLSLFGQTA